MQVCSLVMCLGNDMVKPPCILVRPLYKEECVLSNVRKSKIDQERKSNVNLHYNFYYKILDKFTLLC